MRMRPALFLVGILTGVLAVPLAARADIYKWVDEKGVVNYSNIRRPEGVKVVERFEEPPANTIPGIPREQLARQRELALEARVERLERELYEAQRANATTAAYDPYYSGYGSYPGYYPGYGYPAYGYPIVGVRTAHFRRFPVGVRPIVRPLPVHSTVAVRTVGVRTMRR